MHHSFLDWQSVDPVSTDVCTDKLQQETTVSYLALTIAPNVRQTEMFNGGIEPSNTEFQLFIVQHSQIKFQFYVITLSWMTERWAVVTEVTERLAIRSTMMKLYDLISPNGRNPTDIKRKLGSSSNSARLNRVTFLKLLKKLLANVDVKLNELNVIRHTKNASARSVVSI